MKPNIYLPIAGLIIAPPCGVLLLLALMPEVHNVFFAWLMSGAIVSWVMGAIFGLPTYIVFLRKGYTKLHHFIIGGFVISAIPWLWFSLTASGTVDNGSKSILVNGAYTTDGIIATTQFVFILGSCGAFSGLIFWLIVKNLITRRSTPTLQKT